MTWKMHLRNYRGKMHIEFLIFLASSLEMGDETRCPLLWKAENIWSKWHMLQAVWSSKDLGWYMIHMIIHLEEINQTNHNSTCRENAARRPPFLKKSLSQKCSSRFQSSKQDKSKRTFSRTPIIIYRVFIHSRCCRNSSINSIKLKSAVRLCEEDSLCIKSFVCSLENTQLVAVFLADWWLKKKMHLGLGCNNTMI